MKLFLLPRRWGGETSITLSGKDFHYLARVLRKREGDIVPALAASGERFTMRIEEVGKSSCRVALVKAAPEPSPVPTRGPDHPRIHLLQCLPKGRKMDLIVRQAVEAGVDRITPVQSDRSVAAAENPAQRMARWERIAREALQQSGNARPPHIEEPQKLRTRAVLDGERDIGVFFHQERIAEGSLHRCLAGFSRTGGGCVKVIVGPEGGLSETEVEYLRERGFEPAFLGETVLRTETAALYAIAAVRTLLQERDAWTLSE